MPFHLLGEGHFIFRIALKILKAYYIIYRLEYYSLLTTILVNGTNTLYRLLYHSIQQYFLLTIVLLRRIVYESF